MPRTHTQCSANGEDSARAKGALSSFSTTSSRSCVRVAVYALSSFCGQDNHAETWGMGNGESRRVVTQLHAVVCGGDGDAVGGMPLEKC